MINEIQPKIKFQNIVQCPFKKYVSYILHILSFSSIKKKQKIITKHKFVLVLSLQCML